MEKELFPVPGLEVFEIMDQKTGWMQLLFRSLSEQFGTVLKWNPLILNDEAFWKAQADKIKTLLYNRIKFEDKIFETEDEVLAFIDKNFPSYSPKEKLDIVLEHMYNRTSYDGETRSFSITDELGRREIWRKYFFINAQEFIFYLDNLKSQGLITWSRVSEQNTLQKLSITLNGLTEMIKITEKKNSPFCFVAMSFSEQLQEIFDTAISPAITEKGFRPLIIRKEHVESDRTVTDAIIAGIKKSRFTIADFTEHKPGVYFEAGYALGRGQKVIYTCRKDNIDKAHFDTRNFQHVVWENADQLKSRLIDKIEAYILD